MATATVSFPVDRLQELEPYSDRLGELLLLGLSQVRVQEAMMLYRRGLVSFGRSAELAGVSEQDMSRHMRAAGLHPHWDETMVEEELA
ncbi:MAG: antitoxin [Armatimonadetes bacterium CG_4_10_14_3_um_filter_66_18]|nr:antitoxin [Armatimonadota bacterium]OIO91754.1 MAG: hypothetical protein AUJ96_33365 [Armatimonadetes bacterium CG2_30_66_41]PIX50211.1 MAG: antitoxin [Armatimonadetes bacterium CG_4_8_14_3_um_filter_66_20]PIY49469.1 MAG: antitoxin [Armatimonadetes bacterium CG_4_10_14_3_um_filter_66_18]NCO96337.1 antitoxin [Armatimonadota bacterium]